MLERAPRNAIVDLKTGLVTVEWLAYFQGLSTDAGSTPPIVATPPTPPASTLPPIIISGGSGTDVGSGTIGRISKWVEPTKLGDSIMSESGTVVQVDGTLSAFSLRGNAGNVRLDDSGLYISPAFSITPGAYANSNAVRWTNDLTYRTAIWRSDSTTPSPVKAWNFENIQLYTDTVIVDTVITTKLVGLGTSYGEVFIKQEGKGSVGETTLLYVAHRHDGVFSQDHWCGLNAWTGTNPPDPVMQIGYWTSALGPAVGFNPASGFTIHTGVIDVVGKLRWWDGVTLDANDTIKYVGEVVPSQLGLHNNLYWTGSAMYLIDTASWGSLARVGVTTGGSWFDVILAPPGANPAAIVVGLNVTTSGVTAPAFIGDGAQLTSLNATQLTSGTVPAARIPVSAASRLLGRGSTGAGAMEEITLGAGLTMAGTVLSSSGGGGGGTIGGSGTVGKLPVWAGVTSLGDSPITDNGSYINIVVGARVEGSLTSVTTNPALYLWETPMAVDHRYWRAIVVNEIFYIQTLTDVGGVSATPFAVSRTGYTMLAGGANVWATQIIGAAVSGQSYGLIIYGGYTGADYALSVQNRAATRAAMAITGDMVVIFQYRVVLPVGVDLWAP